MDSEFIEEEKSFQNGEQEISGSLVLPKRKKTPFVLLLPGSGSVDRNENGKTLFRKIKTNNLKSIAHYLAKNGFASYRYDKRGVGKSKTEKKPGFDDLVSDSKKAIEFIKNLKNVDTESINVLGHSEGGVLGLILANEKPISGYIGLCTPINSLDKELARQIEFIYKARGKSNKEAKKARKAFEEIFELMKEYKDWERISAKKIKNAVSSLSLLNRIMPSKLVKWIFGKQLNPNWFIESFDYNFKEIAKGIKCPSFLIYGEKDYQVPSREGEELKEILQNNGGSQVTLDVIENMNHLLRSNPRKMSPKESLRSVKEKNIEKKVLEKIGNWLKRIN